MNTEHSKLFEFTLKALPAGNVDLLKSLGLEGKMVVDGPFSSHNPDFEGETITKSAIENGIGMFNQMGRHVDWDHQYRSTLNPKFLIGRGVHNYNSGDGTPNLVTHLYDDNDIAKSAWQLLKSGGELGYSVEGRATKRSGDRKTIHDMHIFRVTLAPSPLGMLDTRVRPLGETLKSLQEDDCDVCKGWIESNRLADTIEELTQLNGQMPPIQFVEKLVLKSYTTGQAYVPSGQMIGAAALRPQLLTGPNGKVDPVEIADDYITPSRSRAERKAPKNRTGADALILKGIDTRFVSDLRRAGYSDDVIRSTWDATKGYH